MSGGEDESFGDYGTATQMDNVGGLKYSKIGVPWKMSCRSYFISIDESGLLDRKKSFSRFLCVNAIIDLQRMLLEIETRK